MEEFDRENMALASERGRIGVFGRIGGHSLLSIATIGMSAAALVVSTLVIVTTAGLHTANGGSGAAGAAGPAGASGAPGTGTSWGTLTVSFQLGGKATGLVIDSSNCAVQGHGAYACTLAVSSVSNITQKIVGLSYPTNPNVYYAGADPTIGAIVFTPGASTTFTLWFQAVQVAGNSVVPVTLLVNTA